MRVVLVDDTPSVRLLLRYALEAAPGFEVVGEAGDGREAVDVAGRLQPHLILLDLAMPVMDGLQALPLIRERSPDSRVIVLSGFSADRMESQALALGAVAYLEKAHSPQDLVDRILAVTDRLGFEPAPAPEAPPEHSSPGHGDPVEMAPFQAAFERAPVGIALISAAGRWLRANKALCDMLGRRADDFEGRPVAQVAASDSGWAALERARQRMAAGEIDEWEADARHVHADGRIVWAGHTVTMVRSASGAPDYLVVQVQDVSRHRLAEEESRLVHELARAVGGAPDLHSALEALVRKLCDSAGWACGQAWVPDAGGSRLLPTAWYAPEPRGTARAGRTLDLTHFRSESDRCAFERGVGLPGRVWETRTATWVPDLTPDNDRAGDVPRARAALDSGLRAAAAVPVLADGRLVAVVELFIADLSGEDPPLLRMVAAVASRMGAFLERKQAEDALRESEKRYRSITEALEAARDEAMRSAMQKSALLAAISHEMRTPLNAVVNMTSLLAGSQLDEEQADWARTAADSAGALMDVINDVLDFSKVEAGKLELESVPFSLAKVLETATSMVRLDARAKQLSLEVEVDPSVPATPVGDAARFRQVLVNLLANAVKFTDRGGVTVRLSAVPGPPGDAPAGGGQGGRVVVRTEVVDTGVGIDLEQMSRLFEPFAQGSSSTSRRYGGTGLGLAICRQLVTAMAGEIGVDSRPGEGSTFWFTACLGAGDGREPDEARPLVPGPAVTNRDGRVLIVEDDEVTQKVGVTLVRRLGYPVEVTASGEGALSMLASGRYAAVLLDCHLPGLDGFATARAVREQEARLGLRRTPVIAMTGAAMPGDRERCLAAGMDDYITKPVNPGELGRVLDRWTTEEEPPVVINDDIDWDRLATLRKACGGERGAAVMAELVGEYLSASVERLGLLEAALGNGNAGDIELVAHAFKGSSATFGATAVAATAAEIERWGAAGDLALVPAALEVLRSDFEQAAVALRREIPAPQPVV